MPTSAAATVITNSAKTWPVMSCQQLRERHEVHVHRVQHQLDGHEDQHGVAAGQHAVDAGREQPGREEQHERQRGSSRRRPCAPAPSRRSAPRAAGTRPPRTAARSCGTATSPTSPVVCRRLDDDLRVVPAERALSRNTRPRQHAERRPRARPAAAGCPARRGRSAPREHETEQEQDHDRADVDQDLHPGDELGRQQQVHRRPPRAASRPGTAPRGRRSSP